MLFLQRVPLVQSLSFIQLTVLPLELGPPSGPLLPEDKGRGFPNGTPEVQVLV